MYDISNHLLTNAKWTPSPNVGGFIKPVFITNHYTAGWTASSAIRTFNSRASKVSAHLTIDTDGTIYQHVPFNRQAWHAGPSAYRGYTRLNNHSIGIELVNPGFLRKAGDFFVDDYGHKYHKDKVGPVMASPHRRVGSGMFYWPLYTPAQLDALDKVTQRLIETYDIIDINSHEEIDTRGWKTDPGPAFPMNRYKKLLGGGRQMEVELYEVTASSLNVRSGPGGKFKVLKRLPKGTRVPKQESHGSWVRIDTDGWVHGAYLRVVS